MHCQTGAGRAAPGGRRCCNQKKKCCNQNAPACAACRLQYQLDGSEYVAATDAAVHHTDMPRPKAWTEAQMDFICRHLLGEENPKREHVEVMAQRSACL